MLNFEQLELSRVLFQSTRTCLLQQEVDGWHCSTFMVKSLGIEILPFGELSEKRISQRRSYLKDKKVDV